MISPFLISRRFRTKAVVFFFSIIRPRLVAFNRLILWIIRCDFFSFLFNSLLYDDFRVKSGFSNWKAI